MVKMHQSASKTFCGQDLQTKQGILGADTTV